MVRLFASLALLFFLAPVTFVRGDAPRADESQHIVLERVAFDASGEGVTRAGRLEFLDGWKLDSDHYEFGGVSAMLARVDGDGDTGDASVRFTMLSDAGTLIGFTLDESGDGSGEGSTDPSPARARRPFIAPLPDGPPIRRGFAKKNWDAESITHDAESGRFWVGFEQQHSIWRYGRSFARVEARRYPDAMTDWPTNGGAEALLRWEAGDSARFAVLSEHAKFGAGATEAFLFDGDPTDAASKPTRFGYRPPSGFNITDAALLPDGRAIVLHRRFNPFEGVSAVVSIADPRDIRANRVWKGTPIARLAAPMRIDNMEAIAVTRDGADTIVWIASDDNFNGFQETLLLKFRLLPKTSKDAS